MAQFNRASNLSAMLRRVLAAQDISAADASVALLHAAAVVGHQAIRQSENPAEAHADFLKGVTVVEDHVRGAALPGGCEVEFMKPATAWVC